MKRPAPHYLTLVMLSAVCFSLAVLVNDLRCQRDILHEVGSQLISQQIAMHRAIDRLADLHEEPNRD